MLPQAVIDALSARLAALPDLRLPAQLRQGDASDERKRDYLTRLLQHDPGGCCNFFAQQKAGLRQGWRLWACRPCWVCGGCTLVWHQARQQHTSTTAQPMPQPQACSWSDMAAI